MNTYDFDKTIFYPDSSCVFIFYCFRHFPAAFIKRIPAAARKLLRYYGGKVTFSELKEQIFSFLSDVDGIEKVVEKFWVRRYKDIEPWYLKQKRDDDIIISASPEFLLRPVCDKLGVRLIATKMDTGTGKIIGANCHDFEKVRRFYEEYPDAHTECFYSDSLTDTPMAEIADRAFLVDRGNLSPWPKNNA